MPRVSKQDRLFETRWVHVFEEDTPAGAVYRPEESDIPLSRRPRERLVAATQTGPPPYSTRRPRRSQRRSNAATWREESDGIVVRTGAHGDAELQIVERSADRLLIRRR